VSVAAASAGSAAAVGSDGAAVAPGVATGVAPAAAAGFAESPAVPAGAGVEATSPPLVERGESVAQAARAINAHAAARELRDDFIGHT